MPNVLSWLEEEVPHTKLPMYVVTGALLALAVSLLGLEFLSFVGRELSSKAAGRRPRCSVRASQ